jgi:hypothetical protein
LELTFISYGLSLLIGWSIDVFVPSVRLARERGLAEHLDRGRYFLDDCRKINLNSAMHDLLGKHGLLPSIQRTLLGRRDIDWMLYLAIFATALVGGYACGGTLSAIGFFLYCLILFAVFRFLAPLVAERERVRLLRRNVERALKNRIRELTRTKNDLLRRRFP